MILASRSWYAAHLAPVARLLGDAPVALVASYADHVAARRTGLPIVVMEHGVGQSYLNGHPSYPGGRDRGDAALFLTPNDYSARLWRERYPDIPAVAIGSPRLDTLASRVGAGDPVVAVSFHWPCKAGGIWSDWTFPEYKDAIAALAQRMVVIGHGHPRSMDTLGRWYQRVGIEPVRDFDEVCRRADVYVCDNSSTLFEFASTGRPVVVLNSREWQRGKGPGLRFWDAADVGINIWDPRDLPDAVDAASARETARGAMREQALGIAYSHRFGAAQRALWAIHDIGTVRVAA